MKCLCCNQSLADQFSLKEHFITWHEVDENYFFWKLFMRDKFLCQESVFVATVFVWIKEMKKIIIFSHITRWEVGNILKINIWKKKLKDNALIVKMVTIMSFMSHEN